MAEDQLIGDDALTPDKDLVGPGAQGPVGPGVDNAPPLSHNPAAMDLVAHPGLIHSAPFRVLSKIGSAAHSPAAVGAVMGLKNIIQGAEEGLNPSAGKVDLIREEQPIKNAQANRGLDIKDRQATTGETNAATNQTNATTKQAAQQTAAAKPPSPDAAAYQGYLKSNGNDPVAAFQAYEADKQKQPQGGTIAYNKGLPVTITDGTGKKWDAKDPALPPELAAHVKTANDAYAQSTADALKQRVEGYQTLNAPKWATVQLAQAKNAGEIYQPARDADQRYERMTEDAKNALSGNQQAMVSLLTNHIGMTLGQQKGARITKDILHEAQNSVPFFQGLEAKFGDDGYLSGVTLTPQQINQMLDLAKTQRDLIRDNVLNKAQQESQLTKVPGATSTSTNQGGRAAEAPPVNLLKEGQITHFKNGQSWELKDGKAVRVDQGK